MLTVAKTHQVYQSRDSQPSKARASAGGAHRPSLSKPRFPAIQSANSYYPTGAESLSKPRFPAIQSAATYGMWANDKSIKAAIPSHPKPGCNDGRGAVKVYQSRDSQPSKAAAGEGPAGGSSLSKPRFPAIQSVLRHRSHFIFKSIKAAIPSHPKRVRARPSAPGRSLSALNLVPPAW